MKKEILAIIPARGRSKGVPNKNIRLLCGKPLIYYAIRACQKSKLITRTIVSTDSKKIAKIARKLGAEVPFLRPAEISGDFSTDIEYLTHALNWLKNNEAYVPDIVLRVPPTSPLRTAAHLDQGIKILINDSKADAVRPITKASKHPYKMWRIKGDYIVSFLPKSFTKMNEPYNMPRQKLPKAYIHTGAMDVMRKDTILKLKSTSGRRLRYFFMDEDVSVNIDSETDFLIAEAIMKKNRKAIKI